MKFLSLTIACLLLTGSALAQSPPGPQGKGRDRGNANEDPLSRLLAMDKDQDGQLAEDEVTDRKLRALFNRADTDKDKVVTRDELQALIAKESKNQSNLGSRMGPGGGPGGPEGGLGGPGRGPGFGGPNFGGPSGQGFPGGPGLGGPGLGGPGLGGPNGPGRDMRPPMPRPGTVLPDFMINELRLSSEQSEELGKLQKLVDERLASILTQAQQDQLKQMSAGPGEPPGFGPGGPRRPNF